MSYLKKYGILIFTILTFAAMVFTILAENEKIPVPQSYFELTGEEEFQREAISLNSAKFHELMKIPGMTERIAENIIDYRIDKGGFSSLTQLLEVEGIGEKTYEELKFYLYI